MRTGWGGENYVQLFDLLSKWGGSGSDTYFLINVSRGEGSPCESNSCDVLAGQIGWKSMNKGVLITGVPGLVWAKLLPSFLEKKGYQVHGWTRSGSPAKVFSFLARDFLT